MTDTPLEPCSMLFVPADTDRFLGKAGQRGADGLILDLEDAVARPRKAQARANLAGFVPRLKTAGVPVHVRVNNEPELLAADVEAAVAAGADGLLMPKVDTAAQLLHLDEHLTALERQYGRAARSVKVVALIESPLGVLNAMSIAVVTDRTSAMLFGSEDFSAALGIEAHPDGLTGPAQQVILAAVAAGVQPMGLPGSVADFGDAEAYRALAVRARRIGMRGAICIHPAQVAIVNEVFGGTAEEADRARRLLEVFDASVASGKGAVAHEGRMIDEPIAMRARRFLARREALQARRAAAPGAAR